MGFEPKFIAQTNSRNRVASIALSGELDMSTVPILEAHLAPLEGNGVKAIVLDLRDITFLDCAALHAFLAARDRAATKGHRLILVGASRSARRLFELTRMEFLLDDQDAVGVLNRFVGSQTSQPGKTMEAYLNAHA